MGLRVIGALLLILDRVNSRDMKGRAMLPSIPVTGLLSHSKVYKATSPYIESM